MGNNDPEFVFWLDYWRKASMPWPKSGRFKCIVTRKDIRITSTDNDSDKSLNLDISSILACKLGYAGRNKQVDLILGDQKIYLGLVHPFDPIGIQNYNHDETWALMKVIEAFRSNADPKIDPNAYIRQSTMKSNLKYFKIPDIEWDTHTSPWSYYYQYQGKFLDQKIFIRKMALGIVIIPIIVLLILGIAYVLDVLNII